MKLQDPRVDGDDFVKAPSSLCSHQHSVHSSHSANDDGDGDGGGDDDGDRDGDGDGDGDGDRDGGNWDYIKMIYNRSNIIKSGDCVKVFIRKSSI